MPPCSSTPWVTGDNKAAVQIWALTMQGKESMVTDYGCGRILIRPYISEYMHKQDW